ncbi:N-6 DNA methylase [Mycolicibacterium neworleansense]|nr:N-6 DNA methylase [Mycolicibacterium neworleansense]
MPAGALTRIATGDMDGSAPADYHLAGGESVRDAANRVWAYMRGVWTRFQDELGDDAATGLTRDRFLLPLLNQLDYGRVPPAPVGGLAVDADPDKRYPISHLWGDAIAIHLLGAGVDLDKRSAGTAGAAKSAPQSMVQEYLNRADTHLWSILSNGRTLRLLRDSTSLTGSAYIEFDLDAIFSGELFSDFLLLFRMCHQSRLVSLDAEIGQASCWMERWREAAAQTGTRMLDQLRDGVVAALETLGNGFLTHPDNQHLRERIGSGELAVSDFHHALLRVVYRLLFTFVAEDRGVLHTADAEPGARERYARFFSTDRLRDVARRRLGDRHTDRWQAQVLVWRGLASPDGMPELGLPALGGLFENGPLDFALDCRIRNADFLSAVRSMSVVKGKSDRLWKADYRNLDAEELGSIYESLLEFHPVWNPVERSYSLLEAAGNERKGTGSYYTPTSLVECLLDSALEPVLDRAAAATDPEEALLAITVCDPACGSGHFLVAAARRIAKCLAAHRSGESEPPPKQVRAALRDVVDRCVYGVDVNPLAAELAKVSLWLEAVEPGRPLAFLDAQVKFGNALIGATPAVLADGIPNEAFAAIEGDDKKTAASLERRNKLERDQPLQDDLFGGVTSPALSNSTLATQMRAVLGVSALSLADVAVQRQRLASYSESREYQHQKLIADTWCAAFVWPKTPDAPTAVTERQFRDLLGDPDALKPEQRDEVQRLTAEYRFFHWHLEFPHIFSTQGSGDLHSVAGWGGGFTAICANPPWDKVDFEDKKYFDSVNPEIANTTGTARKAKIEQWILANSAAGARYRAARRKVKGTLHFAKRSGVFPEMAKPVKGVNSIQLDHLFAEQMTSITHPQGHFGALIPTTIANGAGAQHLFKSLVDRAAISAIFDFENAEELFKIHRSYNFCMIAASGRGAREPSMRLAFGLRNVKQLTGNRIFELTPEEIQLLNPNTGTLPTFQTRRDADITLGIYRRVPVLVVDDDPTGNPWQITTKRLYDMTDDSHLFRTRAVLEDEGWTLNGNVFELDGKRMLPLYEGKMAHHYDHRWATFSDPDSEEPRELTLSEKSDPDYVALPRYWVPEFDVLTGKVDRRGLPAYDKGVSARLAEVQWGRGWLLGWRDVCRATDERTAIAGFIPRAGAGHTEPLLFSEMSPTLTASLVAALTSFPVDFACRQKIGGIHLAVMTLKQLPLVSVGVAQAHAGFIVPRVAELACTATDMADLAVDLGYDGPLAWDEDRRATLRAELDAYMFILYGVAREDVEYIMDSFRTESGGLKNNEIAKYGRYRSKEMILEKFDRLSAAGLSIDNPVETAEL